KGMVKNGFNSRKEALTSKLLKFLENKWLECQSLDSLEPSNTAANQDSVMKRPASETTLDAAHLVQVGENMSETIQKPLQAETSGSNFEESLNFLTSLMEKNDRSESRPTVALTIKP